MQPSTYKSRVARIQAELGRRGLSGLVVIKPEHVRYVSGFWGYSTRPEYASPRRLIAVVVPASGGCTLVLPKIELLFGSRRTWLDDVRRHVEWEQAGEVFGGVALLEGVLKEKGIDKGRLGLEFGFVSHRLHGLLKDSLPGARFEDATDVIEDLRMVKSPEEIEILRIGGRMAVKEFAAEVKAVRAGVREYEIAMAGREAAARLHASHIADSKAEIPLDHPLAETSQIVASGPRLDMVHTLATTRVVRPGDMLMLDLCRVPQFQNYRIGFSRNVSLRRPTAEEADRYRITMEAYWKAVAAVRPGVPAEVPDLVAREHLDKRGLADTFVHRTGRGVGIEVVERPEIGAGDKTPLAPGMVVTIEPSIYFPGFAVHVEDTYLITGEGAECLTECPRDLKIVRESRPPRRRRAARRPAAKGKARKARARRR
jgi:Xaa-Pro aminopeptidase